MKKFLIILVIFGMFIMNCAGENIEKPRLMCGLDNLILHHSSLLDGKKVGIITNQTAVTADSMHIVDAINGLNNCTVTALFAPEHGIRGELEDAKRIKTYKDEKTGIQVWSLYGKTLKPTDEMLENVDILVYDILDIGARFYTFISTLGLAMEKAAEKGVPFVVLDRPNPITGTKVEGPSLFPEYKSFVGRYPIPVRYGLTVGELAKMINGEGWLEGGITCDLTVIEISGWNRNSWLDEYALPWIKPSPNIPDVATAEIYPGICFLEGTNINEGRGTYSPFKNIGAPWIDSAELIEKLASYKIPGVKFTPASYTPVIIPGMAMYPKHNEKECHGITITVTERELYESVRTGIYIICAVRDLYPDKFKHTKGLNRLYGSNRLSEALDEGKPAEEIIGQYVDELMQFKKLRQKYSIYPQSDKSGRKDDY